MIALSIFLAGVFTVVAFGVLAAWSDIRGMTIPNLYSSLIIGAFMLCYLFLWLLGRDDVFGSLFSHLTSALIVFLITLMMFMAKAIGAGDAKLATAFAFWVGIKGLFPFVFFMSVVGGLLGLASLALRKWTPVQNPPPESWVARVQAGESKVPYGVAIVAGALASFMEIGYFDLDVLASFVLG